MGNTKARRRAVVHPWGQYQDKVSFLLMQVAGRPGSATACALDAGAAFPYFCKWRCFAAGAVPGLQNQWMAERSSVGSTPIYLRQLDTQKSPVGCKSLQGTFLVRCLFFDSLKKRFSSVAVYQKILVYLLVVQVGSFVCCEYTNRPICR